MAERVFRTGCGFDAHRFCDNRKLILGGVPIEHPRGLEGHSDADVVLHAIADALLGAAALGDIGGHFPDTDPAYKDISSLTLLAQVRDLIAAEGWSIVNVDAVVICEQPRIAPHAPEMRRRIAECLSIDPTRISIKATTTERLGFTGRGEGIACEAVTVLEHVGAPDRAKVREAIESIKRHRKGKSLGGLTIREAIEEGRRY